MGDSLSTEKCVSVDKATCIVEAPFVAVKPNDRSIHVPIAVSLKIISVLSVVNSAETEELAILEESEELAMLLELILIELKLKELDWLRAELSAASWLELQDDDVLVLDAELNVFVELGFALEKETEGASVELLPPLPPQAVIANTPMNNKQIRRLFIRSLNIECHD